MEEQSDLIFNRTELLIGKENLERVKNSNVCICGLGGVGSYTFEALARMGIKKLTVIDKDKVDHTNINRQLVACLYTVGVPKVEVAKIHLETINKEADIVTVEDYIDASNVDKYITKGFDYCIDAIDSLDSKVAIIQRCKEIGVPVISSMGMANRLDPLKIKVEYIEKTKMCPLARSMRKKLAEKNISKVKVIYSEEEPVKTKSKVLGSVPYVPSVAGLVIASEVVKDIINK